MTTAATETFDRVLANLELFDDWQERYRYIIDLGSRLPEMEPADKTDANQVHGCQSTVWMKAWLNSDNGEPLIEFTADSDSHIVKGLLAILHAAYDRQRPCDIREFDVEARLAELDLQGHLSPTRQNGLHEMVRRIKALACEHCPTDDCPDDHCEPLD